MVDPQIEKLLIVQHHDIELLKIQQDLIRLPAEQKASEASIEKEKATIEVARQSLLAKELARKEIDAEVKSKEGALLRFRTQQSEVKKNDEYKALLHQIEQTEIEISELEEREIGILLEIDSTREQFEEEESEIKSRIEAHHRGINLLIEREATLSASLEEAEAKVAESRIDVNTLYLEQYDQVKKTVKRPPYIAEIKAHKCSGCHLKVSNDVARAVFNAGEPHFCDQCARMVYV
ncbi:MAG: putative nucleic acid-binding Zn-ribbon protein [Lentimonas sp.]|jgi:predicted  nucleic acid-binding Zn-ribbon protein